jgi:hypothetical protein
MKKNLHLLVGVARFELATSWSQTRRDNRATLHPDAQKAVQRYTDIYSLQYFKPYFEILKVTVFTSVDSQSSKHFLRRDRDSNPGTGFPVTV